MRFNRIRKPQNPPPSRRRSPGVATRLPFEHLESRLALSAVSPVEHWEVAHDHFDSDSHDAPLISGYEAPRLLTSEAPSMPSPPRVAPAPPKLPPVITVVVVYLPSKPTTPSPIAATSPATSTTSRPLAATSPVSESPSTAAARGEPLAALTASPVTGVALATFDALIDAANASPSASQLRPVVQVSSSTNANLLSPWVDAAESESTVRDVVFAELVEDQSDEHAEATLSSYLGSSLERWSQEQDSLDNALSRLEEVPSDESQKNVPDEPTPVSRTKHEPPPSEHSQHAHSVPVAPEAVAEMVLLEAVGDPNGSGLSVTDAVLSAKYSLDDDLPIGFYQYIEVGGFEPTVTTPTTKESQSEADEATLAAMPADT